MSCVVCTVDVKKSCDEYPRKKLATPMEAKTTVIQPTLSVISEVDKYFQPCRLVQLQNLSKLDWDLVGSSMISSSTLKELKKILTLNFFYFDFLIHFTVSENPKSRQINCRRLKYGFFILYAYN